MIKINKGLTLPITGNPDKKIDEAIHAKTVALVGSDYNGMKPTLLVQEGDKVKKGQKLFEDKKCPGVFFTAPVAGTIKAINRGDKRVFQSIVISNEGHEQVKFEHFKGSAPSSLSAEAVKALLVESGLWTAIRRRPFSRTPSLTEIPQAIFVTAIDTNPLAVDVNDVLSTHMDAFKAGVEVLAKLAPKAFVTTGPDTKIDVSLPNLKHEVFQGPHPAGNPGTHIHYLAPVNANTSSWYVNYQDTIAIGKLFQAGELDSTRVISLAGPAARHPRYVKTIVGASLADLTAGETYDGAEHRIVSGSVFGGRTAGGTGSYLGRFHLQVTLLKEGREREFLGWHRPGLNKFSIKNIFVSKLMPNKVFGFTTTMNGSHRSIVPIGSYEAVMPGDFLPTQLLRYLMAKNTDRAIELGALELDEEDLALCTFVDPCKNEFGPALRTNLNMIEKEG